MDYQKAYPYSNNYMQGQQPPLQQPIQNKPLPNPPYQPYQPPFANNQYQQNPQLNQFTPPTPAPQFMANQPEISNVEHILRLNKGKLGTFYFTYTGSKEWPDRTYKGVIEAADQDHLIVSDPKTGKRYLLQMKYLNWAEFDGEIEYTYPFR